MVVTLVLNTYRFAPIVAAFEFKQPIYSPPNTTILSIESIDSFNYPIAMTLFNIALIRLLIALQQEGHHETPSFKPHHQF